MKKSKISLLIDLDGVLRLGKTPAPGFRDFLHFITEEKINSCILSNTTLSTSDEIRKDFEKSGFQLELPLLTAAEAAAYYIKSNYGKAAVFCSPSVQKLFDGMEDFENPDVVVMGDLGKDWTFEKLNSVFKYVHAGVPLVAMQKNKFWKTPEDGMLLDLGAFVSAIEYATGRNATVIGKPSSLYFREGMKKIGLEESDEFFMLGDDLLNDIYPVQEMGGKGILIYTGKTSFPLASNISQRPDFEAMNLYEVIKILKNYL